MCNLTFQLRHTPNIHAPNRDCVFSTLDRRIAHRTPFRKLKNLFITGSLRCQYLNNFRDNIPSAFKHYPITDTDVFCADFLFIMQRCMCNRCTGKRYRGQNRNRREHTRSPDLHFNFFYRCDGLLRVEFVGSRPPRVLGGCTQTSGLRKVVDLYNDAINFISEFMAFFYPILVIALNVFNRFMAGSMWIALQTPLFNLL